MVPNSFGLGEDSCYAIRVPLTLKASTMESLNKLTSGTSAVIPKEDLIQKLKSGRKLKIKLGIDPTSPDLHLGHAVVFSKLKDFQDLGHEIIFLIGDYTARIGDPSGRSKTRPPLTDQEIQHNFQTYLEQIKHLLDTDNITIRYNSEWLDKLTSKDWLNLCGKVTLSRIIERDDFANRLNAQQPIGMHELLYPLLQGYDSVALEADVELGGTDQTFNLLMGRHLQEHFDQEPQVIMTLPILPGLDGVAKMSKSLGNAIGLSEKPSEAYGKLMSISDNLMWTYFDILLKTPQAEIDKYKAAVKAGTKHPMDLKKEMAFKIIEKFWNQDAATKAKEAFENLFQKKNFESAQKVDCKSLSDNESLWIVDLLKKLNSVESSSAARRLVTDGAVTVNGTKVTDFHADILLKPGTTIKVGKHKFYRLV